MQDCIFCQIVKGGKEALVWENDLAVAFKDLHPKAPVHILVVPKQHIKNIDELDNDALAGQLLMAARAVAHEVGLKGGYRIMINNGRSGGQLVDHLHIHLLGGQQFKD